MISLTVYIAYGKFFSFIFLRFFNCCACAISIHSPEDFSYLNDIGTHKHSIWCLDFKSFNYFPPHFRRKHQVHKKLRVYLRSDFMFFIVLS